VLYYDRHDAVRAYARANGLDRIVVRSDHDGIGIIAAGKSYTDARQALRDLGLDEGVCAPPASACSSWNDRAGRAADRRGICCRAR
jgi:hypothetical protein